MRARQGAAASTATACAVTPADAGVDLVEDERLASCDGRERERDPRELAARRRLRDGAERKAGVRADEERPPRRRPRGPRSRSRSSARNSPSPIPSPCSSAATACANGSALARRSARSASDSAAMSRFGCGDRSRRRLDRVVPAGASPRARSGPPRRARAARRTRRAPKRRLRSEMRSSLLSTSSSSAGSASSEARKPWRSLPTSRRRSATSRSSPAATPSSGASRSSGASARSARAASDAAPSPSSGASAAAASATPVAELRDVEEALALRRGARPPRPAPGPPSPRRAARAPRAAPRRRPRRGSSSSCRASCRRERAPRVAGLAPALELLGPAERVEDVELERGTCEPPLLELPGHRDQPLDGGCEVLARDRPAPRVRARASVAEDAPREHEPGLAFGPELRERRDLLVVEEAVRDVELGLDVRLAPRRRRRRTRRPVRRAGARSPGRRSSSPRRSRR